MKHLSIYNKINIMIIHKSFYSTTPYQTFDKKQNKMHDNPFNSKQLTNIRHFPPAVREWNNSVYNFNKNNSNYSAVKYNQLDKLMQSYFNLSDRIRLARSKRMRYLRRKTKSKKFYISRPEVKQNNDKISITVYCLDRDKQVLTKQLFFYNRPKLCEQILDFWKKLKQNKAKKNKSRKKYKLLNKRYKSLLRKYKSSSKTMNISFSGIKHIKDLKTFRNKNLIKNKRLHLSLLFKLYQHILSIFNIQIFIPITKRRNTISKENKRMLFNIVKSNPSILYWANSNVGIMEKIERKNINYEFLVDKLMEQGNIYNNTRLSPIAANMFKLEIFNKLSFIVNRYIINNKVTDITLLKILNNLTLKLRRYFRWNLYKEQTRQTSKLINLFQHSLLKFKKLLPVLKRLIDSIYNKKTELNLVNLKYFYLNSDIFTQVLIPKIKKRISAVRLVKKSLRKVKLTTNLSEINKVNIYNNVPFLSLNNSLLLNSIYQNIININSTKQNNDHLSNNVDRKNNDYLLNTVFNGLYPNNFIYNYGNNLGPNTASLEQLVSPTTSEKQKRYSKTSNVLKTIKYKSLLGVSIKAKGRLTRRNTAARSVKYMTYKGSFKDEDKSLYLNKYNNISTVILRNDVRSNTQYTSKGSFRRIGSFGIKTWISSK